MTRTFRQLALAWAMGVCLLPPADAGTNYVALGGSDGNNGTGWGDAWASISNAVARSAPGATVLVSNGLYQIASTIVIDKDLTLKSYSGRPEDTIIRGSGATLKCLYLTNGNIVVDGFTITNGLTGVHLAQTGTVQNCIITGHRAGWAYGIYLDYGGVVDRCVIRGNLSTYGGAVYLFYRGTVRNSLIAHNTKSGSSTSSSGGGVTFRYGPSLVENCTIARNTAQVAGGGVHFSGGGGAVRNCIVYDNQATVDPNYNPPSSGSALTYTCSVPAPSGTGSTGGDPYFADPPAGNFRILPGSPCTNAGLNAAWMQLAIDLAGRPRTNGVVDMGCYEYYTGALDCNVVASPTTGFSPTDVVLRSHVDGTNLTSVRYHWDFDNDGSYDLDGIDRQVVTQRYETAGTYSVALMVSNATGETVRYARGNYLSFAPSTVYVARGGNHPAFPYDSWPAAASNLQDAVDAGVDGTHVWVSNGVYIVTNRVNITRRLTVQSMNGKAVTVIDGNRKLGGFRIDSPGAVVDGFTITNGLAAAAGLGVHIVSGGTLRNCDIVSNTGNGTFPGGFYIESAASLIQNCRIWKNQGGGYAGGGGSCDGGTLRNCLIVGNQAAHGGAAGGVLFGGSGGVLESCTVVGNAAEMHGGVRRYSGNVYVRNCILKDNYAYTPGVVSNWTAVTSQYASNICVWPTLGINGTDKDPGLFSAGGGWGVAYTNGNYHLVDGSPCIDTGANQAWMTNAVDLDGLPRILNRTVNMGAYEGVVPLGTVVIVR